VTWELFPPMGRRHDGVGHRLSVSVYRVEGVSLTSPVFNFLRTCARVLCSLRRLQKIILFISLLVANNIFFLLSVRASVEGVLVLLSWSTLTVPLSG
ncbi:hypothetical protein L9F63_023267, partial [Diploptera punctata]